MTEKEMVGIGLKLINAPKDEYPGANSILAVWMQSLESDFDLKSQVFTQIETNLARVKRILEESQSGSVSPEDQEFLSHYAELADYTKIFNDPLSH